MKNIKRMRHVLAVVVTLITILAMPDILSAHQPGFTDSFMLEDCNGFSSTGSNPFFILEPGYQLILEGEEGGVDMHLTITVLNKTKTIEGIKTRIVEERETHDGELVEVSRNFFAICNRDNSVIYFGEDVFICEDGLVQVGDNFLCDGEEPSHEGAWRAGGPDDDGLAEPGIIMPGTFLLGSRYFQELADGIALDRAEHVEMGLEVTTEAGTFDECVKIVETTPLEPGAKSEKIYCPEVGLVVDDVSVLTEINE
ncbi:MAG: hypothetical protein XU11_C0024G0020 [Candidatus Dadabacteria bacterium CSP1-2]|jgi:hypothetical protein|nr:MAG: hypothetical protein XU11_C0024G0020 [Candidatus Dadabacteria bacterium CSP1-2]